VVVLASLPTALIGLALRDVVESLSRSPLWIGLGFLVTTAFLLLTLRPTQEKTSDPGLRLALLVGVLQGAAVLPGVSRSGLTISVLLLSGVRPARAFELSMLIGIPAILGATLLEIPQMLGELQNLPAGLLGAVVAFLTGLVALLFLRRAVTGGRFGWFALWVGPLSLSTLALAWAWPG